MVKYFCDKCGEEVTGQMVATSLDMTGKVFCHEHYKEYQEMIGQTAWTYNKSKDDYLYLYKKATSKLTWGDLQRKIEEGR